MLMFTVIFRMFIVGAEINFFEYHHRDLILNNKLFIEELALYKPVMTSKRSIIIAEKQGLEISQDKISLNENFDSFIKALELDEPRISREAFGDKAVVLIRTLENINDKIIIDHIVRPMKIFCI